MTGTFLTRTDWLAGLEIAGFVLIGLVLVVVVLRVGPLAALVGMGLLILAGLGAWVLFRRYGLLVDPSFPLLGSFLIYSAMVFLRFAIADGDRRQLRRAFANYVAPALLTQIERSGDRVKLGGEVRELTVMFADVRNFTSISEALSPEALLAMLNTLFGALGAEVTGQFGTIDKFIGDALMAFWNAPVDVEDHAARACAAALGMRRRLVALNAIDAFGRRAGGLEPADLALGIGISTGEALVGNMGLETRFDYSCLGDTVNVASRVEGACKTVGYDIVVVEQTRRAAPDFAYLEAGSLKLKGKTARGAHPPARRRRDDGPLRGLRGAGERARGGAGGDGHGFGRGGAGPVPGAGAGHRCPPRRLLRGDGNAARGLRCRSGVSGVSPDAPRAVRARRAPVSGSIRSGRADRFPSGAAAAAAGLPGRRRS